MRLPESGNLECYHASMKDFLLDQSRSRKYWIELSAFRLKYLAAAWEKSGMSYPVSIPIVSWFDQAPALYHPDLLLNFLYHLEKPSARITHMLLDQPLPNWTKIYFSLSNLGGETRLYFLNAVQKLVSLTLP